MGRATHSRRSGPDIDEAELLPSQLIADVAERGDQAILERTQSGNDADADDRSNQAVLDSRGTRFVVSEASEEILHDSTPSFFESAHAKA
jgi:hypothetical protein